MLLGYPPGTKGYRLLGLTTNQTFVSRDTIFHENIFPMNPATEKPYNHHAPVVMPYNHLIPGDDIVVSDLPDYTSAPNCII